VNWLYWYNPERLFSKEKMKLLKRIPKLEQITPVYAVIVVMIYTWSLLQFFWRLPSFLYYSTLGEIAVIFSYMAVVDLLESVLVLLVPVLLAVILPQKWYYDQFVTKGTSLVLLSLGYFMLFYVDLIVGILSPWALLQKVLIIGLIILALTFLIDRVGFLSRFVQEISNRAVVFLYVWIPVSLVSLLTVLIRNIF
jgi:hypothetical protein